jgi:hypothetical protein
MVKGCARGRAERGGMVKGVSTGQGNMYYIFVRYHDDGSKKLNACILSLSHMVYL